MLTENTVPKSWSLRTDEVPGTKIDDTGFLY
jgi:hypothetical protein